MNVQFLFGPERNGRHYQRQTLSGVLLTYLQQLSSEVASRNCAYTVVVTE